MSDVHCGSFRWQVHQAIAHARQWIFALVAWVTTGSIKRRGGARQRRKLREHALRNALGDVDGIADVGASTRRNKGLVPDAAPSRIKNNEERIHTIHVVRH